MLAAFFSTCISVFAQSVNPFAKYSFDQTYSIVGLGRSSEDSFQKYSFILRDTADFNILKQTWNFNKRSDFYLRQEFFEIFILKGKELVDRIIVNPTDNNIQVDNNWYYFDNSLLEALHEKFPLEYHIQQRSFRSESISKAYADSIRKEPSLIYASESYYLGKHEGQFYITYNKSKTIPNFQMATKAACKLLGEKAGPREFSAAYDLSDYNIAHENKFRITVESSKAIYDKIRPEGFAKGDWEERDFEVYSYWLCAGAQNKTEKFRGGNSRLNVDRFNVKALEMKPEYSGGISAFYDYIQKAFQWPEAAVSAGVSGKLIADFIIEKDGSITDVKVVQDLGYGTGEELIRVLRNSKKWQPGKIHGIPVRYRYSLPLSLPPPPQAHSTLAVIGASTQSRKKLPPLQATKGQYYFEHKLNKCGDITFVNEDGKQALSDRFSILNYVVNGFNADTLNKLIGRASYQVVIDSTGKCCTISSKNETNLPDQSLRIDEIIDSKTIWNVLPSKSGKKEAVSAILVFTFTEDKVKYQHVAFDKNSDNLVELEFSEKNKGGRW